ncbi:hypothetical protein AVEN_97590-1 [Araneus ventricosus]|uniref:LRRCT domain-containing protein n=1 Tax=Araneus ventricosus TaxID=182803 RepID=A0A4Y2F790_ARAVE|nr:hypothetical protein AVEN_97590-1 [Araneus ventricosus]
MFAFCSVFFLTALFGYAAAIDCPPEFLTRPCICIHSDTLECENITDISILDGVIERTGSFRFNEFKLIDSKIDFIPSTYLQRKLFVKISIQNSQLTSLFDKVSDVSNNVKFLRVQNVSFSNGFPWEQLKTLKKLQHLVAVHVNIPSVGRNFKNNVSKYLKQFNLFGTNTTEIEDGAFSDLKYLVNLKIQNCELEVLKRSYFPRPANIRVIFINGNKLTTLPDDIFEDMPNLKMIELNRNKLSTISEAVFEKIHQKLVYVRLEDNPLNCDCSLRWILTLTSQINVFGTCAVPESLNGKPLQKLEANDFGSCS